MKKQIAKREGFFFTQAELAILIVAMIGLGFVLQAGIAGYTIEKLFPKTQQTTVIVVGQVPEALREMMLSEDFRQAGVVYTTELNPEFLVPGVLDRIDVAIVTGKQACGQATRKTLADFVRAGNSLIVFGDACTKDPEDAGINGWYGGPNELGPTMPARLSASEEGKTSVQVKDKFRILSADHPIFWGITNFNFDGKITLVQPNNAEVLAVFGSPNIEGPNAKPVYAMLEKRHASGGKAIYVAIEPNSLVLREGIGSRNLLLNLLLYAGQKEKKVQIDVRFP